MAERIVDQASEPEVPDAIKQRVETIKGIPRLELQRYFPLIVETRDIITPIHLFSPLIRRGMLLNAQRELAQSRVLLSQSIVGANLETPAINRGLQLLIAVLHNDAVETQGKDRDLIIVDDPDLGLIAPSSLLLGGVLSIERQLSTLPKELSAQLTLLDIADHVIVQLAQGREPRGKLKSGRRKKVSAEERT